MLLPHQSVCPRSGAMTVLLLSLMVHSALSQETTPTPTEVVTTTGSTFTIVLVVMICLVVIAVIFGLLACFYAKSKSHHDDDDDEADATIPIRSAPPPPQDGGGQNSGNAIEMQQMMNQQQQILMMQQLQQQQQLINNSFGGSSSQANPNNTGSQIVVSASKPSVGGGGGGGDSMLPGQINNGTGNDEQRAAGPAGISMVSAGGITIGGMNSLASKPAAAAKTGGGGVGNSSGNFLTTNTNNTMGGRSDGGASANTSLLDKGSIEFQANDDRDKERLSLIKAGQYQKMKLIGRGAFGSVFSVLLVNGQSIAMKEMTLNMDNQEEFQEAIDAVNKEVSVLWEIDHPNVVRYFHVDLDRENSIVRVFMELVTGGSLGSMARSLKTPLAETVVQKFMIQALSGLAYVHGKGVVHRDLKGDNILLATTGEVKLADFGTARDVGQNTRGAQTMLGTPYFMAPELLVERDGEIGYGTKADIWSMGITAAELLNMGKPPWPDFSNPGMAFIHIADPNTLPLIPEHCSEQARAFILHACQRDPAVRPTASELLQHPWLLNEDNLQSQTM